MKTAFTLGPKGFFEFNKISFGLTNALLHPKTNGNVHGCLLFPGNILIFSCSFSENLDRQKLHDNKL